MTREEAIKKIKKVIEESVIFEDELEAMRQYEPQLYLAVNNVFADSYAYTRSYRNFVQQMRNSNN